MRYTWSLSQSLIQMPKLALCADAQSYPCTPVSLGLTLLPLALCSDTRSSTRWHDNEADTGFYKRLTDT